MKISAGQFELFGGSPSQPSSAAASAPLARKRVAPSLRDLPPVAVLPPVPEPAPEPVATMVEPAVLSVSEVTRQIKGLLEGRFLRVAVTGEISNFKRQGSGHLYFTLKDADACLPCVMWRREAARIPFELKDGLQILCHGRIEVYAPHGKYQMIAEGLEPMGAGALALAFEQLKEKLQKEGLFDRKRPLPFLARRIGVITSPTGAALRDFLRVLHLRYPGLPVQVVGVKVQGDGAASEIAAALDWLSVRGEVDVIVLTRGGGSMEDLWAFNEEVVSRAIARCLVPVVSAVGHEIDFTIADFVADHRAPTPTGAAERLAPVRADLTAALAITAQRLRRALQSSVQARRQSLLKFRMRLGDPRRSLGDRRVGLADLEERLRAGVRVAMERRRLQLRETRDRLERQNPRAALLERLRELQLLRVALDRSGRRAVGVEERRLGLRELRGRLGISARAVLQQRQESLGISKASLEAFSPQRVFERGYSMTRSARSRRLVRSPRDVVPGEEIEIVLGLRLVEERLVEESLRAVVQPTPIDVPNPDV
jgi:exodeoxyribonuclease VII large subunit